jgi:hypothetical protein
MRNYTRGVLIGLYSVGWFLISVLVPTYFNPIQASYWTPEFKSVIQPNLFFNPEGTINGYALGYNVAFLSIPIFFLIYWLMTSKLKPIEKSIGTFLIFLLFAILSFVLHFRYIDGWTLITLVFGALSIGFIELAIEGPLKSIIGRRSAINLLFGAVLVLFILGSLQIGSSLAANYEGIVQPFATHYLAGIFGGCVTITLLYLLIGVLSGFLILLKLI